MDDELYFLDSALEDSPTAQEYIEKLINKHNGTKNYSAQMQLNSMYLTIGAIEAFYYARLITQRELTNYMKYFGM